MGFISIVGWVALAVWAWRSWAKVKHLPSGHPRKKRGNAAALVLASFVALFTVLGLAGDAAPGESEAITVLWLIGFVAWCVFVRRLSRGLPSAADMKAYEAAQPQTQATAAPEPPIAAAPARPLPQARMPEPEMIPASARPLPRPVPRPLPSRPLPAKARAARADIALAPTNETRSDGLSKD